MSDRNALYRGALATISLYLLIVLTFFLPYVSLLTIWLIPLPLMFLAAKDGWKLTLSVFGLGLLFLVILNHSFYLLLPLFFMLLGGVVGYMIYLKKSTFALLLAGSLTNIAVLIVCLAVSVLVFHFNPALAAQSALNDQFQQSVTQMPSMIKSFNLSADELMTQYKMLSSTLVRLTPVFIIIAGVFYALIVELISLPILRKLNVEVPHWIPFRNWQVPRSIIWLYLAVLFIVWFGADQATPIYTAALNVDIILRILLAVQGFSLIFYYTYIRKFPLVVPITVTLVTVIFGPWLLQLACILGIIDLGFNIRKKIGGEKL
ncbi:YybS family protein [Sporolactobacillus shoreicorticis]|uniref:YybS family protein n=1 Tax=Sporolactobacillus shoreicorticis TaxID=1923877 RepID=A0ABW5S8C8_9BACL|nr:DUF2232 domain-containing protein [Sporolactobacillus shoreicorticis]MCO7126080.1 YybS family protein [Sporolactobacillus shoreicorticis]